MKFIISKLFVLVIAASLAAQNEDYVAESVNSIGTLLVSTIDGQLRAIDPRTGGFKWSLNEEPVLHAPISIKQGFTFLPNPQDGSLYVLKEGALRKLPFTIPQLVNSSPCRGTDGVLYAGSKKDVWFGVNPFTGAKVEHLSSSTTERFCPANQEHTVFLGRSEYRVTMFDTMSNGGKVWNVTFSDYSAHLLPVDVSYPYGHYVSSSTGEIITIEKTTGRIVWESDFRQPVVAIYLLLSDGLHKLPFTVIGKETMESLVKSVYSSVPWSDDDGRIQPTNTLFPTLYVGESKFGLYAMSAFVDENTITMAPKYLGPPLLEGPSPIALTNEERRQFQPSQRKVVRSDYPSITHKTIDGEFLVLGYHEPPTMYLSSIIPARFPSVATFPHIEFKPEQPAKIANESQNSENSTIVDVLFLTWKDHPWFLSSLVVTLLVLLGTTLWLCGRQAGVESIMGETRSAQTSRQSNGGRSWVLTRTNVVPDGWMCIGKVTYNPLEVLGRGCEGTVVYRGTFEGREVAVKRVVSEFVRFVDREAELLRESDFHPHVIRYFCMESDSQFRYLALELCLATLHDFVEQSDVRERVDIDEKQILHQATRGIQHLHSMQIVHRDMKPQNVLLAVSSKGQVRAVISDFGLSKCIQPGRHSVSKRSGVAGTDGWIAPEALFCESTSFPVDIFSMGCIFFYVLSKGVHPFGANLHRQANILNGAYDVTSLKNRKDGLEAISLIESMLLREPRDRPTATAILRHPLFWNGEQRLKFFGDVSDRVEKEEDSSILVRRLERNARAVVAGGNWRNVICKTLSDDLRKHRTYKGHSVRDLLRAMRNKKHHYRELSEEVRKSLGSIPDEYVEYFTSRFPQLLLHTYEALEWCASEPIFYESYADEVRIRMAPLLLLEEQTQKLNKENVNAETWTRGQTTSKDAAGGDADKAPN